MSGIVTIRPAQPSDCAAIRDLIHELAVYEKLEDAMVATPQMLETHLFETKKAHALMAEADGKAVGFALYFYNFSTFLGKPGIYLEDLFVKPAARSLGIGKLLLKKLAGIAVAEDCGRFEWSVLNWNEPAIGFYKKIGAKPMDEWSVYRMDAQTLKAFAES